MNESDETPVPEYQPVAGVKSDLEKLLTAFTGTESVRYESFIKIWQDLKVPLIFSGRQTDLECREFTEECMHIAVAFWLPPYNFQVRVGGLYLLYGLYFKQIFQPAAKIRITIPQWKDVMLFEEEVKKQQHLDVEYVFTQLKYHNAFHFVAHPLELYPKKDTVENVDYNEELQKEILKEQRGIVSEVLEADNIEQLSEIHNQYYRLKCALAGPHAKVPSPSLNVIQPNLIQYITKTVTSHEEWRKAKAGKKHPRKRRDSAQATTSESEADSDSEMRGRKSPQKKTLLGRRQALREKAFTVVPVTSRSRRHRQAVSETEIAPESPAQEINTEMSMKSPSVDSDKPDDSEDEPMMSPSHTFSSVLLAIPKDLMPISDERNEEEQQITTPRQSSSSKRGRGRGKKGKSGPGRPPKNPNYS